MYLLSIEQHLDRILSTTKNTLILAPHVGLSPIFIDRVAVQDDLILDLKDEVLENLENFEPRVQEEHLSIKDDGARISLLISVHGTNLEVGLT